LGKYDDSSYSIILSFFKDLEENDLGFFTNHPTEFPEINFTWQSPFSITNAIIDFSDKPTGYHNDFLQKLVSTGCNAIQIRCFYSASFLHLNEFLRPTRFERVQSIEIYLPYTIGITSSDEVTSFIDQNLRITKVVIFGAPEDKTILYRGFPIILSNTHLLGQKFCGNINANNFVLNIQNFTESKHHNSCLNRKISIDVDGNIKNCPSMAQSFGNIKDTTLQEALDHPDFKKYWNITKDQIAVCKDCEFRYICTDCRAYLENPEDMYAKPLKCGYNPYTCEWEEWSTHPLKQQAIDYYGMREVLPEFKLKPDYVPPRSNGTSPDSPQ
jgi:SPASM domain peptide maturase of grasp-with-spasm system